MRIAICDDNQEVCKELKDILNQADAENDYSVEIDIFNSGEDLYRYFIENDGNFDLIFLDIEFPGKINGLQIANIIRNRFFNNTVKIVYISSFEEYMKDAFQVQPFDFIVKPVLPERVCETIKSAHRIINKQRQPFEYKIGKERYKTDLYKILYFVSRGRKIEIATVKSKPENDQFYGKISDVAEQLSKSDFFFTHKSYLVNYHNIIEFQYKKLRLINNEELVIAQTFRKQVRTMRMEKIGEK